MKILKVNVTGLPLFQEPLEIDLYASQRVYKDKNEMLTQLFKSKHTDIYTNNVLAFLGINASGKTTTLKVLSFAMQLLKNKSIKTIDCNDILNGLSEDAEVCMEIYFYDMKQSLCKLQTYIAKKSNNVDQTNEYIITKEALFRKKITSSLAKNSLFSFGEKDLFEERNLAHVYLLEDVSIIVGFNKTEEMTLNVIDSINWTDINGIRMLGEFPIELVKYLDPSIESLECDISRADKRCSLRLKFLGKEELFLDSPEELNYYLSSGTIKGLNVFIAAMMTIKHGGYFIIDELENHFNMEIVSTLIRFFTDDKINNTGATLIFSTHYVELVDDFERNDCIYVSRNSGGLKTEKLNTILTRNDVKRSEWFRSGYWKYTTPSYKTYIELKRKLVGFVQNVEVL